MSIEKEDRKNLVRYRIEQAEETVEDVRILIENKRFRSAINRIYYGMFHSLLAPGLEYKFQTSKHTQLIGWFNKNFVHEGIIERKYGKILNKAFNRRTRSDYDIYVEFDEAAVREMFEEMQDFISTMKRHLKLD
jgi:uncharacterized protein (UPF0332 family)